VKIDSVKINFDSDKISSTGYEQEMGAQNTKSYHHGNLRDALVSAGLEILEREGPSALSLRAVARKAGVSHAAPAHHFPTLGHLLGEIEARGFEEFARFLDEVAAQGAQDPESRLKAIFRAYIEFAMAHKSLYTLMFQTTGKIVRTQTLESAMQAAWDQLAAIVAAYLERSSTDSITLAGAVQVWSMVHGFVLLSNDNRFPPAVRDKGGKVAIDQLIAALPQLGKGI
jgi:AcrR family transcriptional regulator